MNKNLWFALGTLGLIGMTGPSAQAGHYGCGPRWSIGIGIGVPGPGYYRPYGYYPYYPYYYYPPPPPPVVVQQVPVPVPAAPVPPPPGGYSAAPAPNPVQPAAVQANAPPAGDNRQALDFHLQNLANNDERQRADSAMALGKMRDPRAIDPLAATLSGDRSPMVRDTAARALGLIGTTAALPALQHAAQVDADHDVRRSAQFAAEIIQSR